MASKLKNQIKVLEQSYPVKVWNDQDIVVGNDWNKEIREKLKSADIMLFLVSADLINSEYINKVELKKPVYSEVVDPLSPKVADPTIPAN